MVVEVVIRIEQAVRVVGSGLTQFEPIVGKSIDETSGARVGQETFRLRSQHLRVMQGTGGGQLAEFRIRRRVPKEISQPCGQGVVVQTARLLLQVKIGRRAEYGGVAGEHRLGEGTAGFHRAEDDWQETYLFLGRDGRAVSLLHETTEQTLGILGRILGHDVISERRAHGALGRQIIEQYRVRRGGPLGCNGAFDLNPAHHEARLTFRRRQRILRATGTWTGAIETDGVDPDGFTGLKDDIEFVDGHVRIEVDVADAP